MKLSNPYKEGSRKAAIYDTFLKAGGGEKGLAAAQKHAARKDVGIKQGTVKSWASGWLKGQVRPDKKPSTKPDKVTLTKNGEFHPLFKYTSRDKADKEHEAMCNRNGIRAHAFHVIENEGRFAVVPANYQPGGPVPTFKVGDIVYDALIANSKAKVIEAGPEQTLIRYAIDKPSRPREDAVINRFLVKLPDVEAKASNKKLQKAAKDSGALTFGKKPTPRELEAQADKLLKKKPKGKTVTRQRL